MRPLKEFEEYLIEGTIKNITPDIPRARSLIEESEKRNRFLKDLEDKIGLTDDNANYFIENSYDILIELIRAELLKSGYQASGLGAHEAEVSYMRNLEFSESEVRFMNDLRYFRNGILYYGKDYDKDYARKVIDYLKKIFPRLLEKSKS